MLHVSGEPIPGAIDAVRGLRADGHRIRFVTNSTTSSRRMLGERLRTIGFAIDDEELQTTGAVAARVLAGKRVLALTMAGFLDDLEGLELIGMNADAVLVGGADESDEPGRIYSYLNLNRAFLELQAGAELYCLHRNRWWQTTDGPRLDAGAFVAGLEYAAGIEATVLGKPSAQLLRRGARGDRRRSGAHLDGRATTSRGTSPAHSVTECAPCSCAPASSGRTSSSSSSVVPDGIVSSIAQLPDWLEGNL